MNGLLTRTAWDDVLSKTLLYSPRLLTSLVLMVAFLVAGALLAKLVRSLSGLARLNEDVRNLIASVANVSLIVIGVMTALGTLGIDVTALVTGLGLTGFALGIAFKDIISNALAGILILIYEPFRRGDRISVTALEGIVTKIDLRQTTLQRADRHILIPNSNLLSAPIIVFSNVGASERTKSPQWQLKDISPQESTAANSCSLGSVADQSCRMTGPSRCE